ncbi:hypothetical protein [Actinoplanes sp. NPDC051411]|uniref:hypothetical protein n=1 Tax=Actinoplanes sp. NPDC051411 TaxID=3155522 RepID=UPI0034166945
MHGRDIEGTLLAAVPPPSTPLGPFVDSFVSWTTWTVPAGRRAAFWAPALRAAGDTRPVRVILLREFPVTVALEVLLGLSVLMVAPFLHGSARNQAFQADAAKVAPAGTKAGDLPEAPPKTASASTRVYGPAETVLVVVVMAGGHRVSGRLARRRVGASHSSGTPEPALAEA